MTLIAPRDHPWSCNSTRPPAGQAMSHASNSSVRATSRQLRSFTLHTPSQVTTGASREATSAGSNTGRMGRSTPAPLAASGEPSPEGRSRSRRRIQKG